jgi:hypothetical protein
MLCYRFPSKRSPLEVLRFPAQTSPLAPCRSDDSQSIATKYVAIPHSTEQDTQPIAFVIGKQANPYRTRDDTSCPGVSTPMIWSLAYSSTTCHNGINHLHHSNHYSNHSINPHTVTSHLDGWKTTTLSQRHKPNTTSQRMERHVRLSRLHG